MTKGSYLAFSHVCRTIAGMDAIQNLADVLHDLNVKKPLLLVSSSVKKAGLVEIVLTAGEIDKQAAVVHDGIEAGSSTNTVAEIVALYLHGDHDGIIAVGGGSVLDTAKAVNLVVSQTHESTQTESADLRSIGGLHANNRNDLTHMSPLIAIPTTAGPGSAASQTAIIHSPLTGRRILLSFPELAPHTSILDPQMLRTLPPTITAAGALSALGIAIESITSLAANPISTHHATRAATIIFNTAVQAVQAPHDLELRLQLALASHLAGTASSQARASLTQAMSNSLGAFCKIPYSTASLVLLPYALEYNLHKSIEELAKLYQEVEPEAFLPSPNHTEIPSATAAQLLIDKVRGLATALRQSVGNNLITRFFDLLSPDGEKMLEPHQFESIALIALGDASILYSREELDAQDIIRILEAAYWGYPLDRDIIRKGHQNKPLRETS
jgi:alcohol dehydrogenase